MLQSLLYGPQAVPADTLLYADLLDAWFQFLRESSRFKEAEPIGLQALALHTRLLGEQHLLVAESMNNLALLRQYTGNYSEAIRLHQQALAIRKSLAGENSQEVAESLHNLGTLYNSKRDWASAERYLQQALAIKQQIMPATPPSIRVSKARLAGSYIDSKQYARAIPLLEEVLAGEQSDPNSDKVHTAIVLRELADAHHYLRHVNIAERYYLQALDSFAASVGKQHYAYAVALNGLGWLYKKNGKPEQGTSMIAESERLFDAIK
ncbi:tetratricopeptide repeat protein [Vogesella facilis]|uniref:Tetratricopeptide repeat protein n=1 Tax=Vogesella facilis TaxID=1655232 RepID=A0ABV7RD96_9NEIS